MRKILLLIITLLFSSAAATIFAQESDFIKEYLERLENSRKYLIQVAETMPEDYYNFKATPESMSFAENLLHIGFAMDWHSQSLLGEREAIPWSEDTRYKVADRSKEEMIEIVDQTFDDAIELITEFEAAKLDERLDYFEQDRTKRQILMLLSDHITHHRGQMVVYMRLNGLVPPRYVLYQ